MRANPVACWAKVVHQDSVDDPVCRGLKAQRKLDANVFLRCVIGDCRRLKQDVQNGMGCACNSALRSYLSNEIKQQQATVKGV